MRRLLISLLLLVVGCIGDVGDENNNNNNNNNNNDSRAAKEIFKADVHPAVAKCSGAFCHDAGSMTPALSKFYAADAELSYTETVKLVPLIGDFSELAPILQKINAGHKGVSYSADEQTKIKNWLVKETAERKQGGGGGGEPLPPPFDPKALLKTWSGCMTLDNFNAAGMTQAWSTLAAGNQQKCLNCHIGGLAGFLIMTNAAQYFQAMSENTAYLLKYFGVNNTERKVVISGAFKAADALPENVHPGFDYENNAGMVALKKFYDSTMAKATANTCDPPRLKD